MVCPEKPVICVPINSIRGERVCLEAHLQCNGEEDCLEGQDEENCGLIVAPGIQAVIALAVIGVIIAVPIIYVFVRRRQRKPVIPPSARPVLERILPCCVSNSAADRSSQQLTAPRLDSPSDKLGLSNGAFDSNPTSAPSQPPNSYSVTGKPLNRFRQETIELERVPSIRDWQANRLQQPNHLASILRATEHSMQQRTTSGPQPTTQHVQQMDNSRKPSHGERASHITYAPSAQRESRPQQKLYSIASSDGRTNHEAKSHLQNANNPAWEEHTARSPRHYQISAAPPSYASVSTGVPPNQLRQALERVAVMSGDTEGQSHDTVV
ncbi:uncharacterized protein [Watersipora subatra]|uniref:uncharacterized protein n=1 Tax=Watersipora subatra TaxID=2589382 RepID=UPI00355BE853